VLADTDKNIRQDWASPSLRHAILLRQRNPQQLPTKIEKKLL
jgi:hypothetical protein